GTASFADQVRRIGKAVRARQRKRRDPLYHLSFHEGLQDDNCGRAALSLCDVGKIYFANMLADKLDKRQLGDGEIAALRNAIDEIVAISAYYINLFRCYTLTIAYMNNSMSDEDLQKALEAHGADWVRKMDAAKRAMFRPERVIELAPDRQAQFLLAASEPYR